MTHVSPNPIIACPGSPCGSYRGGHNVHPIQARKVGESPWGWRDATIAGVNGLEISLAYVIEEGNPVVWHHRSLGAHVVVGDLVRLHEQYFVLGTPAGWFSVAVSCGLGPVPAPEDADVWAAETSVGIVELATGIALPTDHERDA